MLNIAKKLRTVSLNSKFTGSDANSVLTVLQKRNTIKVLFLVVINLSYILLRVKALLDWLHSYQQSAHDCRICSRPVPASTRNLFLLRFKLI